MQNLYRKGENAFFLEVYKQILCPLKKNIQFWSRFIKIQVKEEKKKSVVDGDKEIVFSKAIKAGKRIYYLDVKKNRKDEMFLAITESKKIVSGEGDDSLVSFEKHKIFLYKEDFEKFTNGLQQAIQFITDEQGPIEPHHSEEMPETKENENEAALSPGEIKIDIDF